MRGAKNYGSEKSTNARQFVGRSHFYRLLLFVVVDVTIIRSMVFARIDYS